jgi:hypothetical protein
VRHVTADSTKKGDVPIRIRFVEGNPSVDSTKTFFTPLTHVLVEMFEPTAADDAKTATG